MPVHEAQYYAELARAYAGGVTRHEMIWEISLTEAHGMILAAGILYGEAWIWTDANLSRAGRKLLRMREIRDQIQRGEWRADIDL